MTPSSALAAILVVAQVSTSSTAGIPCSPKACRNYRDSAAMWHGQRDKAMIEIDRLSWLLMERDQTIATKERAELSREPCPEEDRPWAGWPFIFAGGLIAAFGLGVFVGLETRP